VRTANKIPQGNRDEWVVTRLLVQNTELVVENSGETVEKVGNLWGKGRQKNKNCEATDFLNLGYRDGFADLTVRSYQATELINLNAQ